MTLLKMVGFVKKIPLWAFKKLPFLSRKQHGIKCLGLENISCSLLLRSRFEWEKSHLSPLIHRPRRSRNEHGKVLLGFLRHTIGIRMFICITSVGLTRHGHLYNGACISIFCIQTCRTMTIVIYVIRFLR